MESQVLVVFVDHGAVEFEQEQDREVVREGDGLVESSDQQELHGVLDLPELHEQVLVLDEVVDTAFGVPEDLLALLHLEPEVVWQSHLTFDLEGSQEPQIVVDDEEQLFGRFWSGSPWSLPQ